MDRTLMWLAEAAELAAASEHLTDIRLEPGRFVITAASSSRDPRAPDGASYSFRFFITLRELGGLNASPFPLAIRLVNRKVAEAFTPFRSRPTSPPNGDR